MKRLFRWCLLLIALVVSGFAGYAFGLSDGHDVGHRQGYDLAMRLAFVTCINGGAFVLPDGTAYRCSRQIKL